MASHSINIINLKGCFFHFGQSLFKKLTKLGLDEAYDLETEPINNWFRMVVALALIPKEHLAVYYDKVVEAIPSKYRVKCKQFINYVKTVFYLPFNSLLFVSICLFIFCLFICFYKYYFEKQYFKDMWNHYDSESRTYNPAEGYNNKLNNFVGVANPNMFKVCL